MEENLGEIIFDIMTSEYKDKVDKNKDLEDYLKEKTKNELLALYSLYGYAGNIEYIVEDIEELQRKKKEEVIKKIIAFLDTQIITILQFFDDKRLQDLKEIAKHEDYYVFDQYKGGQVSFDTIKILKQLNFIFSKREGNGIIIHIPKFIKNKVNNIVGESFYLDCYKSIISYSKGIADTYGAINIQEAYEIISRDVLIQFKKYESIIKFVSLLELEPIYYSFRFQSICNFNIKDEEIKNLLSNKEKTIRYNKELYEDIANDNYIFALNEYREFRNFLKRHYEFDINEDDLLRGEIINDYIDAAQINENKARKNLSQAIDRYFDIEELQKIDIISYVDKIRKRMPNWKLGGNIEYDDQILKIGRNEPCYCGSGKKHKNCHGK